MIENKWEAIWFIILCIIISALSSIITYAIYMPKKPIPKTEESLENYTFIQNCEVKKVCDYECHGFDCFYECNNVTDCCPQSPDTDDLFSIWVK